MIKTAPHRMLRQYGEEPFSRCVQCGSIFYPETTDARMGACSEDCKRLYLDQISKGRE